MDRVQPKIQRWPDGQHIRPWAFRGQRASGTEGQSWWPMWHPAERKAFAGRPVFGPTIAPPSRDLERLHNGKLEALKEAAVQELDCASNEIKQINSSAIKDVMIHVKKAISYLDNAGELLGVITEETKP